MILYWSPIIQNPGYHKPDGGYGDLTKELLDRIDRNGFDFTKYDYNNDGLIDHLFIVVRGDSQRDAKYFVWTGASCLDGRCSSSLVAGGPRDPLSYDGKTVDWNTSGSYIIHRTPGNIAPQHYHVRLMAHEIGHDLWAPHFVHIPGYSYNDVPLEHNRANGRDCIGYVLMAGAGGAWDCSGSETISAYERDLLDWIDCTILTQTQRDLPIEDLYSSSECYIIPFHSGGKKLYLSNLQRIGFFDRYRRAGAASQFELGLRTTGLLVHLSVGRFLDIVPADNNVALSTNYEIYDGDLYGPETTSQLTPWTRPNSNGYTQYSRRNEPQWHAIDNIRYDSESPTTMRFDFYKDFRTAPTIREDSWIGSETSDYEFTNTITVSNSSTLTISADLTVSTSLRIDTNSRVRIDSTATVHLSPDSALRLKHGSILEVEGTLILDGDFAHVPGATMLVLGSGVIRSTRFSN